MVPRTNPEKREDHYRVVVPIAESKEHCSHEHADEEGSGEVSADTFQARAPPCDNWSNASEEEQHDA